MRDALGTYFEARVRAANDQPNLENGGLSAEHSMYDALLTVDLLGQRYSK